MKKTLTFLFFILSLAAAAQKKSKPCMPADGFWVVESNVNDPRSSTVYFYSSSQVLVNQQEIQGKRVNIKRRKTAEKLNALLHQSLIAWRKKEEKVLLAKD